MNKNIKTALIALPVLIGGYFIYKKYKNKNCVLKLGKKWDYDSDLNTYMQNVFYQGQWYARETNQNDFYKDQESTLYVLQGDTTDFKYVCSPQHDEQGNELNYCELPDYISTVKYPLPDYVQKAKEIQKLIEDNKFC